MLVIEYVHLDTIFKKICEIIKIGNYHKSICEQINDVIKIKCAIFTLLPQRSCS